MMFIYMKVKMIKVKGIFDNNNSSVVLLYLILIKLWLLYYFLNIVYLNDF